MKISFILLAHESSEKLKPLIEAIIKAGSNLYIHHDATAKDDLRQKCLNWDINPSDGNVYFAERVKVTWGEWSIVKATLNCIDKIFENNDNSDYFMLISGSCFPIKPIKYLEETLSLKDVDYIESVNVEKNRWITAGIQEERWNKYHFFNWRYQRKLFDFSLKIQNKFKINRVLPLNHTPHMGSQWWCLRNSTLKQIHDIVKNNKKIESFYRKTWVPDELFFQTFVSNLIPKKEIDSNLLTRYIFNSWGIPKVYYDDNYLDILLDDKFFVRKISHSADVLKQRLRHMAVMEPQEFDEFVNTEFYKNKELITRKIENEKFICANKWHSLVTSYENKYDFLKSIPNKITVIFPPKDRPLKETLSIFDKLADTVVYGFLFDKRQVNYGYVNKYFLGISDESTKLARLIWYQVLGEISFKYPNKNIIFCIGEDDLEFLKILRWSVDVNILFLDPLSYDLDNPYCDGDLIRQNSLVNSKALTILEQKNCNVSRNTVDDLARLVDHTISNNHSWRFLWENLIRLNVGIDYNKSINDHYSIVKSISQPIIILVTDTDVMSRKAKSVLKNHHDLNFDDYIFKSLGDAEDKDWHYYLWDFSFYDFHVMKRKLLAMTLSISQVHYLDSLRWNNNLLVVYLKSQNYEKDILNQDVSVNEINKYLNTVEKGRRDIEHFMSSRNCDFLTFEENEFDCLIIDIWNWMDSRGVS